MALLDRPLRIGTDCAGMDTPIMALEQLQVDFEHCFASDNTKAVKRQLLANHAPQIFYDDLMGRANQDPAVPSVDLYISGFPCQPFSAAGVQRGLLDKRGLVFFGCASFIEAKAPRVFLLENVKALLSNDKGRTFKVVMDTLANLRSGAYHVEWKLMDTQAHGVPQSRPRVYIVGIDKAISAGQTNTISAEKGRERQHRAHAQERKLAAARECKDPKPKLSHVDWFLRTCSQGKAKSDTGGNVCVCVVVHLQSAGRKPCRSPSTESTGHPSCRCSQQRGSWRKGSTCPRRRTCLQRPP